MTRRVLAGGSPPVLVLPMTANTRKMDTRKMGVAAFTSGMGALLGYWIEAGRLTAAAEVEDLLGLHLHHGRERARLLTDELHKAVELLAAVGIDPIVIKGAHTAHVYFPDPGTRPASDLDLVIGRDEVVGASRALREGGYVETNRQSRPYKSDWVPPGASTTLRSLEVTHRDNPLTVDLHTTLDRNFFGVGTVSLGSLGASSTRRHVLETSGGRPGGVGVRILAQPLLAASLAAHASEGLHNLSMVRLVELVLVLRRDRARGELVWADLCSVLERADAMRFTYPAFEMAERLVPGTLEPAFRSRLVEAAPARMRRVMAGPSALQRPADRGHVTGRALHVGTRSRRARAPGPAHAVASAGGPFTEGAWPRLRESAPPHLPRSCVAPDIRRLGSRRTQAAPAGGGPPSLRPLGLPSSDQAERQDEGKPPLLLVSAERSGVLVEAPDLRPDHEVQPRIEPETGAPSLTLMVGHLVEVMLHRMERAVGVPEGADRRGPRRLGVEVGDDDARPFSRHARDLSVGPLQGRQMAEGQAAPDHVEESRRERKRLEVPGN